jgi:alkanesulfonate monooxygenase SsuD/methylene tetrahydromethanopterin reductase-like flavin-dependent oxidoreductase (luciferase family)
MAIALTHPRDASINYNTLDYWVEYARTAERGLLDGIFLADVFGVYDVYGGSPDTAVTHAVQLPNAEPTLIVSAMPHATKHLGFGVRSNLTFGHPYQFAQIHLEIATVLVPTSALDWSGQPWCITQAQSARSDAARPP